MGPGQSLPRGDVEFFKSSGQSHLGASFKIKGEVALVQAMAGGSGLFWAFME